MSGRDAKVRFAASLHCLFDSPTIAVQENGTYGGTKAKPLAQPADGFAVCGFKAALARHFGGELTAGWVSAEDFELRWFSLT